MMGLTSYQPTDRDSGIYEYATMLREAMRAILPHLPEAAHEDYQLMNYAAYSLAKASEEIGSAFNLCQKALNDTMRDFSGFLTDHKSLQDSVLQLQNERAELLGSLADNQKMLVDMQRENMDLKELVGCMKDIEACQGKFKAESDHAINVLTLHSSKQKQLAALQLAEQSKKTTMLQKMYFELCDGHHKIMEDYQRALDQNQRVRGDLLATTEAQLGLQQFLAALVRVVDGGSTDELAGLAEGDEVKQRLVAGLQEMKHE